MALFDTICDDIVKHICSFMLPDFIDPSKLFLGSGSFLILEELQVYLKVMRKYNQYSEGCRSIGAVPEKPRNYIDSLGLMVFANLGCHTWQGEDRAKRDFLVARRPFEDNEDWAYKRRRYY